MALRLELKAGDVTQISDSEPPASAVPKRLFTIENEPRDGYSLTFDGRKALVPSDHIQDLFQKVATSTTVDWKYSRDATIQSAFRPLNRIVQVINSTPSYQIFLAGFHVGDAIGLFSVGEVEEASVSDSFGYLVGELRWSIEKRGRLYILPDNFVSDGGVIVELIANGKLFSAMLYTVTADRTSMGDEKLIVPYATPIGFNTKVSPATEDAWRRINSLVSRR